MRVCIVTVAGYLHGIGGMQDHTTDLARGLVDAGNEVEVITARHPEGLRETEHLGARWHFIQINSGMRRLPMRNPRWLRASRERFEEVEAERPFDVVHSESTSALGLLRAGVHQRVPVVAKFHGNYLSHLSAALRRTVDQPSTALREAKHIVWISGGHFLTPGTPYRFRGCEAMVPSRSQLEGTRRSHLLVRERLHVVPNAVDTELFRPGSREGARVELGLGDWPIVAAVGRLDRDKGFDTAIRALAGVPAARLLVVGDGEEKPTLERLARELGMSERVIFAGRQTRDGVARHLNAADIFVFPTKLNEASGLVLLQAMASGLPVVASSTPVLAEAVDRPGENGLLVRRGDPEALGSAIASLVAEPATRKRMGEAARRRILAEYTVKRMIERTLDIYEIALSRHVR